jgi:hypothetical protein
VLQWQDDCIPGADDQGFSRQSCKERTVVTQHDTNVADGSAQGRATGKVEQSEVIRRVATNQRIVVLSMAVGLLGFWLAAINLGFSDEAGKWLERHLGAIASPDNANIYIGVGIAALVLSALCWLFSGQGNRAYEISSAGITEFGMGGATVYPWSAFASLDRNVGAISLNLAEPEPGFFGAKAIVFNLAGIDWSSTELEALLVYHRPDLFSASSQFGRDRAAQTVAA